jgi:hypothetical protein
VIYLPSGTEMVHFPELAHTRLCIQRAVSRVHLDGFPHSEIPGSKPACGSPRLIAACHVLHRLLAPRHSPYALSSLIIKLTQSVFRLRRLASVFASDVLTAITAILPVLRTVSTVGNSRQGVRSGLSTIMFRQAIDKFAFVFHSNAQLEQNL